MGNFEWARTALTLLAAFASISRHANADIELTRASALFSRAGSFGPNASPLVLPRAIFGPTRTVSLVLERDDPNRALPPGAVRITDDFWVLDLAPTEVERLPRSYPGFEFSATPPRRLLLDRARGWTRASEFQNLGGGTGKGVVIGIIDSGVDVTHADLRNQDGSTRVKWLIDFTRGPRGVHSLIETELGCDGEESCAVYSSADIDALLGNAEVGDEPRDNLGHGTHVASLAAGNGLSGAEGRFVGIAPEADLVIARITGATSGISDSKILRGVRFVFDRAAELAAPSVVNLSLGNDFGAHDGSSALERALSSFVGPQHPGRAIVVGAGNSGGLYSGSESGFPGPLGIHTDVHVPRGSTARVPILTPKGDTANSQGRVSAWIGFRPGDALSVRVDRAGRGIGNSVAPGAAAEFSDGSLRMVILNGVGSTRDQALSETAAVVILDGAWPAGETFGIELEGHGTASIWVEGGGDLDPGSSVGPLLPFATKEGTIAIPASAPALIAVGATLNRNDWVDFQGREVHMSGNGELWDALPDGTAFFSAAGPNALGGMKPEIVAPGMRVAGALSALADPRQRGFESMFSGASTCPQRTECLLLDDFHAVSSGTSMAAPLVSGAIALLFERDPSLFQDQVRALIQAGARKLEGELFSEQQAGVGALDLEGALTAQIAEDSPLSRLPSAQSFMSLAASYARPDSEWPLQGYVELRDEQSKLVDGFDPARLSLDVSNASIVDRMSRIAPGLYAFSVAAVPGSGGTAMKLRVGFDGETLIEREVPIAVDRGALRGPLGVRGGKGCVFSKPNARETWILCSWGLAWCLWRTRRRAFRIRSNMELRRPRASFTKQRLASEERPEGR